MDAETMRRRLEKIARATVQAQSVDAVGFWVGDKAGERRAIDDLNAGRRAWLGAYRASQGGLQALAGGNLEMAELYVWQATDLFVDALWSRMEPADIDFLSNSASRRGRPSSTANRNAALAEAVRQQEEKGLKGKAARRAAILENSDLAAAFSGKSDSALVKAIQRNAKDRK